eukprot:SAG31_NODE_9571_length_1257_cov_1.404145_1_plen_161_part_00
MRPLDVGPAYGDAGLQTIRQACAQSQRMRWTVHRADRDHSEQRANAWRETLQSPDYRSAPPASAQVGSSIASDRADEATSTGDAEKENESQQDRDKESGTENAEAERTAGVEVPVGPVAGAGRLGPITAGAPHWPALPADPPIQTEGGAPRPLHRLAWRG